MPTFITKGVYMKKINIVLDYGHGKGDNRGGVLFNEGDNNFTFGKLLKKNLENYENLEVYETRQRDIENPTLYERATMFNHLNPDFYLSIHSNAFSDARVSGAEIFFRSDNKNTSNDLLKRLNNVSVEVLNIVDRGVKDYPFGVLGNGNRAKIKALIEMFFHTNRSDSTKFLQNREKLAMEYAKTIASYFGISKKKVTIPQTTSKKEVKKMYRVQVGAFENETNAVKMLESLKRKGITGFIVSENKQEAEVKKLKSVKEIAKEVLNGAWGNGATRRELLENAGYNYEEVQKEVNRLL